MIVDEDVTWELGWKLCHYVLEVCDLGLKRWRMIVHVDVTWEAGSVAA